MGDSQQAAGITEAGDAFGCALRRWRQLRQLSQQALSVTMGFDRSYISHVEAGDSRIVGNVA